LAKTREFQGIFCKSLLEGFYSIIVVRSKNNRKKRSKLTPCLDIHSFWPSGFFPLVSLDILFTSVWISSSYMSGYHSYVCLDTVNISCLSGQSLPVGLIFFS
jgi:hypothetical protein